MPSAQVAAKVLRARRAAHEHRQSSIAADLVQKAVDEAGLLLDSELAAPEIIEVALLQDAARGEVPARQRVADAQPEEIVLESGGFADESRIAARGALLQMKIHIRIAGAGFFGYCNSMQTSSGSERVIELV